MRRLLLFQTIGRNGEFGIKQARPTGNTLTQKLHKVSVTMCKFLTLENTTLRYNRWESFISL